MRDGDGGVGNRLVGGGIAHHPGNGASGGVVEVHHPQPGVPVAGNHLPRFEPSIHLPHTVVAVAYAGIGVVETDLAWVARVNHVNDPHASGVPCHIGVAANEMDVMDNVVQVRGEFRHFLDVVQVADVPNFQRLRGEVYLIGRADVVAVGGKLGVVGPAVRIVEIGKPNRSRRVADVPDVAPLAIDRSANERVVPGVAVVEVVWIHLANPAWRCWVRLKVKDNRSAVGFPFIRLGSVHVQVVVVDEQGVGTAEVCGVGADQLDGVGKPGKVHNLQAFPFGMGFADNVGVVLVGFYLTPGIAWSPNKRNLTDWLRGDVNDMGSNLATEQGVLAAIGSGPAPKGGMGANGVNGVQLAKQRHVQRIGPDKVGLGAQRQWSKECDSYQQELERAGKARGQRSRHTINFGSNVLGDKGWIDPYSLFSGVYKHAKSVFAT